jgi:CelD/BcsL family acetyltransferase involved in cellulose biosynthesis
VTADLHVTVARSVEELEALAEAWELLRGRHVTAHPDHFLTVLRERPEAVRPHVVLLERDGAPAGLALGRIEDIRLPAKIGYREVVSPRLRALTIVYGGILGDMSEPTVDRLLAELRAALSRREADLLRLRMLELETPLHRAALRLGSRLTRGRLSEPSIHMQAAIPGSMDEFLAARSAKTRQNFRYYAKRLHARYGEGLRLERFHDGADLDRLYEDTSRVAAKTYQRALEASFVDTPLRRALTELAVQEGWFRAYVLYLDDEPVAYWHGSTYRGVHGPGVTGYDPAFRDLRVGTYVLAKRLEDACEDPEVTLADYGFGDAEYKRHVADRSWLEEDVLVYAPSLKGIRTNVSRTAVLGVATVARKTLRDDGRLARVKRWWRDRLRRS